ncbi:MAG TPA: TspO/MBR family protein [Stellaceae bacterium]|nr:TspO/MBR family protein [Stellaceae bacterium]
MSGNSDRNSVTAEHRAWATLVVAVLVTAAAALIGTLATVPSIPGWYAQLAKPWWTPPDALFGPVWTILYLMMAVAAWLVWRAAGWSGGATAHALYGAQLAFNAAWSVLFFGLHLIGTGLIDIALLWLAIAATIAAFTKHSRAAALLLVPYLLWVSYAATLNFGIWRLNP